MFNNDTNGTMGYFVIINVEIQGKARDTVCDSIENIKAIAKDLRLKEGLNRHAPRTSHFVQIKEKLIRREFVPCKSTKNIRRTKIDNLVQSGGVRTSISTGLCKNSDVENNM